MYILAYLLLVFSFLTALLCAGFTVMQAWQGQKSNPIWAERGQYLITAFVSVSSFILLAALVNNDFSLEYVVGYTDRALPLFYRITAFWAGQAGSLLFWAWAVILCGTLFLLSRTYKCLKPETRQWFWIFFLTVCAFFMYLITACNNPFVVIPNPPEDGHGLAPLLQHPGMIFHPPLLFLGYAGFAVSGCLALAQSLSRQRAQEGSWLEISRPFTLISWLMLSAGIILGAWWAYMELGWGGYWAWDPVENASLLPWLAATAFLHTAILETRRDKLYRVNVFLVALTLILTFLGTYLTRSGVVADSVHSYQGGSPTSVPLLIFVGASLLFSIYVAFSGESSRKPLADPLSREGALAAVAVILGTLGVIILTSTLWPVITKYFMQAPVRLEAAFFNRVCLPLFVMIAALLLVCPWLGWNGKLKKRGLMLALLALTIGLCVLLAVRGVSVNPLVVLGISISVALIASMTSIFILSPGQLKSASFLGAHGVHFGLALLVFGVACSGPLKEERFFTMKQGETRELNEYSFTYAEAREGDTPAYRYLTAVIDVRRGGKDLGKILPQVRFYDGKPSIEVDTLPSLGTEVYASINNIYQDGGLELRFSTQPMINWIWIGSVILCLFPFIGAWGKQKNNSAKERGQEA